MTTQTELRALLEDAAYAMGLQGLEWRDNSGCFYYDDDHTGREEWLPHLRDGQGARMEAFLKLNIQWYGSFVLVEDSETSARWSEHFIDQENDQHARRMASLRVAAAIGKAKREQEVAQ